MSAQRETGWILTSMTPGSGVAFSTWQARIGRRGIAFDADGHLHRRGDGLDLRDQLQIVFEIVHRRQEDRQIMRARFDRDGRAHRAVDEIGIGQLLLDTLLPVGTSGGLDLHHALARIGLARFGAC